LHKTTLFGVMRGRWLLSVVALLAAVQLSGQSVSTLVSPAIQANSNRAPGGELEKGVLTLHLEYGREIGTRKPTPVRA
jgi:hypothetical protein